MLLKVIPGQRMEMIVAMSRMPLFAWLNLIMAGMVILAISPHSRAGHFGHTNINKTSFGIGINKLSPIGHPRPLSLRIE